MKPSKLLLVLAFVAFAGAVHAQRMPYGPPITLEEAKKLVAAGQIEHRKINAPVGVAIAVVDSACNLVLLERMDNTNHGVPHIAEDKAYTACAFRVNTKNSQDFMAKGGNGLILLKLRGFTPIEGGEPIIVSGRTVGAIGVSGASSAEDAQIAKAAIEALAK